MSAFGSRSATIDGSSSPARRSEIVRLRGPSSRTSIQLATRPISSQVPSTTDPPGASRAAMRAQAAGTSASSYCRSTLNARITVARSPPGNGTSNPPRTKEFRSRADASGHAASCSRARATRPGSISIPTTRTSGRVARSRRCISSAVIPLAP